MLSGETAAGAYPIESLKTMDKICRTVESGAPYIYKSLEYRKPEWKEKQVVESLAYSCVALAENVDAHAIGVITRSGSTARRIAKFRPRVPLVAFTESDEVRRQLGLVWGVQPIKIEEILDTDKSVKVMEDHLKSNGLVNTGDRAIIATGMPIAQKGRTNMIKISTI
jgi:pyruvate kinase